jgi:hypothetical protein
MSISSATTTSRKIRRSEVERYEDFCEEREKLLAKTVRGLLAQLLKTT